MMGNSEIPKFDLADEIMAEQRKIIATRRKRPGKKTGALSQEKQVGSIDHAIVQPTPLRFCEAKRRPLFQEQRQIIAEIVAGDIAKLRGRM